MKTRPFLTLFASCVISISASSCASRDNSADNPVHFVKTKDSVAAIEIGNTTESDIRQAVIETFLTNGYKRESPFGLTFEKNGDIIRQIEYASYMGGAATTRVDVRIVAISNNSHLVKISAYTVTHQSSSFGDKERKVGGFRKGNYKKLLEEVQQRLPQY